MKIKKFSYILLPIFLGLLVPAFGNEPIIIDDIDGDTQSLAQNSAEIQETPVFEAEQTAENIQQDDKQSKKLQKKEKKQKRKKDDYSEYLIPTSGYLPVGNTSDKEIQIQGAVSKTSELTLADCIQLALEHNPKIQAAYANVSSVKEKKVQTLSNFAPNISINSGISRNKPDSTATNIHMNSYTKYLLGNISISEMVYDFGITQNQYTINKIEWEMSKQNVESTVNSVVRDVKDAYYQLIYAINAKQVREETVQHFEDMYKQADAFYQVGTHPKVDVTIASANLADARANYIAASNAVDLAVSKLNNVMGTPFIEPYIIDASMPYNETDITMKEAIDIANDARPDLKMAIQEVQMADQGVKLAKKVWAPNISFQANLAEGGRRHFTDKSWYSIGGYLNFPVINPVELTSGIKQAKAEAEKQKYNTKSAVNDIYYEIQTSYVSLNDARQRIAASKVAVQKAKESYELSQGRYKTGVCDAIELKEAELTYENAKLTYISNIYLYNSAKASLEKAIGKTLQSSSNQENVEI